LTGPKGDKGDTGLRGPAGGVGDKGDPGADGHIGITGAKGDTGLKGDPGLRGASGGAGATGGKGDTGAQGGTGAAGGIGPRGHTGTRGSVWTHFAGHPPNAHDHAPTGGWLPGDQWLDTSTGHVWNCTVKGVTGTWSDEGVSLKGTRGPQGATGHIGATGPPGAAGHVGAASTVAGPKGATGHVGAASTVAGPKGNPGVRGRTGAASTVAGPRGATGATGPRGLKGATGSISTAAGDARYARKSHTHSYVKKAGDTMTGELRFPSWRIMQTSTTPGLRISGATRPYRLEATIFDKAGHANYGGLFRIWADGRVTFGGDHITVATNGDVMVGTAPRINSQLRNVSHGTTGPPSNMKTGDIHLQY